MKYQDAVELLIAGKYVTRPTWNESNGYLVFLPGLTHFLHVTTQPKPAVVPWAADVENSSVNDWEQIFPAFPEFPEILGSSVTEDAA